MPRKMLGAGRFFKAYDPDKGWTVQEWLSAQEKKTLYSGDYIAVCNEYDRIINMAKSFTDTDPDTDPTSPKERALPHPYPDGQNILGGVEYEDHHVTYIGGDKEAKDGFEPPENLKGAQFEWSMTTLPENMKVIV